MPVITAHVFVTLLLSLGFQYIRSWRELCTLKEERAITWLNTLQVCSAFADGLSLLLLSNRHLSLRLLLVLLSNQHLLSNQRLSLRSPHSHVKVIIVVLRRFSCRLRRKSLLNPGRVFHPNEELDVDSPLFDNYEMFVELLAGEWWVIKAH